MACPNCEAAYDIPDAVLAGGTRMLRCARCAHQWVPPAVLPATVPTVPAETGRDETVSTDDLTMPPPPAHERAAPPEPDRAVAAAAPEPARPPERRVGLQDKPPLVATPPLVGERLTADEREPQAGRVAAAWVLSVALLAGLGGAAYVFRDAVQSAWPPSQLVYGVLGLG